MNAFRITQNGFANDLSGKGAEVFGGRWNSVGVPLLYTALHRSLCILEHLVHLPEGALLTGYSLITVEFPDSSAIQEIPVADLPVDWRSNPVSPVTRDLGNQFFSDCQHLALKVPSVIVPAEFNLLLNPRHPDFRLVKLVSIEPFVYDERLFTRS
ncbi:MAG: RES family NAD+ phosphorylase [Saprospiraceae bacterium]